MFQYASTLVNQRLHFDVFLPPSHRLSSHSRLNAFVIQTKLRGEEPPIIYVQDIHRCSGYPSVFISSLECVDGLCGCH